MPLQMRLPKRGFKSPNRVAYVGINLDSLQAFADKHGVKEVTLELLRSKRYISKSDRVKILGRGELSAKLTVEAHAVTKNAQAAVEGKGGQVKIVE
jgi:large subunit ribosomal protein L15